MTRARDVRARALDTVREQQRERLGARVRDDVAKARFAARVLEAIRVRERARGGRSAPADPLTACELVEPPREHRRTVAVAAVQHDQQRERLPAGAGGAIQPGSALVDAVAEPLRRRPLGDRPGRRPVVLALARRQRTGGRSLTDEREAVTGRRVGQFGGGRVAARDGEQQREVDIRDTERGKSRRQWPLRSIQHGTCTCMNTWLFPAGKEVHLLISRRRSFRGGRARPGTGREPVTVLQIPPNPSNRSSGGGMWRRDGRIQTDRCNGVSRWARHGSSPRTAGLRPAHRTA